MDLLALADFNLVARHGGFGRAARASGRPKATLSRRVSELESGLDLRLFERGARTLKLTQEGRALYERTGALLAELDETAAATRGSPRKLLCGPVYTGSNTASYARDSATRVCDIVFQTRFDCLRGQWAGLNTVTVGSYKWKEGKKKLPSRKPFFGGISEPFFFSRPTCRSNTP
jgi:hypothetical protein